MNVVVDLCSFHSGLIVRCTVSEHKIEKKLLEILDIFSTSFVLWTCILSALNNYLIAKFLATEKLGRDRYVGTFDRDKKYVELL